MNKISIYVIIAVLVAIIGYVAFERSNASKLTGTQTSMLEDVRTGRDQPVAERSKAASSGYPERSRWTG